MSQATKVGEPHKALLSEIYLDNNATTNPLPEVIEAVAQTMADGFGNPSSAHSMGRRSRQVLRESRERVAGLVGASPENVVFTSGATEANNLVLQSLLAREFGDYRLITSGVEHSSILGVAEHLVSRGVDVVVLPVDSDGMVAMEAVVGAIQPGRTLVSIQWANNETGVLQSIKQLAVTAHSSGALFHTDAVQAVGKTPIDLASIPIDFLSLSGHKLHGPLGIGALVGPGVHRLPSLVYGGTQEAGLRPGTENLPGIIGLACALELRALRFGPVAEHTQRLRDRFESSLIERGLVVSVNGGEAFRVPNTSNIRFADIDGEALTIRLDQLGIRCSQSSACTNQKPEPSYVLCAMGLSEGEAYASVRFGFSELNTMDEVDRAVDAVTDVHASLVRFAVA